MKKNNLLQFKTILIVLVLTFFAGCNMQEQTSSFNYDKANLPDAKPWTSENFANKSENFQFVIIGDRTGGANAQGTFKLAMDQINLLQPEFVINVGDLIEGYPEDRADLNSMWDEADGILGKLDMPFFRTIGNHDVSTPETKEVWLERHGVDYYHFVYQDVLFMVINSEDDSRPAPPPEFPAISRATSSPKR